MATKKTFVLRIDGEIYKALEKWASDEFRSVNGQIEWLLQNQLKETGRIKMTVSANSEKQKNRK
jgi:hypothetical protein